MKSKFIVIVLMCLILTVLCSCTSERGKDTDGEKYDTNGVNVSEIKSASDIKELLQGKTLSEAEIILGSRWEDMSPETEYPIIRKWTVNGKKYIISFKTESDIANEESDDFDVFIADFGKEKGTITIDGVPVYYHGINNYDDYNKVQDWFKNLVFWEITGE